MSVVETLTKIFAPWQTMYSDSSVISTTLTTIHIVSLLIAGGLALAADRTTLRLLRQPDGNWADHLRELGAVHRPVLIMLTLLFVSGLMLAAADVETFATSVVFWIKMGLIALLIINGAVLERTEHRMCNGTGPSEKCKQRLSVTARLSIALWLLTTVAGSILMSV